MSVFKIEKNKNYTIMSNYHLRDRNLSYKAKGLLSFMLSLPEDWDYSINGLVAISKEGIKAVRNILQELQNCGYLIIEKKQNEIGQFEYEYLIYETPHSQKGDMELGDVEKDTQINTNEINNNNKEDKIDKQLSSFFIPEEHHILTLDLIKLGYIEETDMRIFDYDNLFNEYMENGTPYRDLIKVINYICPRIIDRKFKDEDGNFIKNKYSYLKASINSNLKRINMEYEDLWGEEQIDEILELYDEKKITEMER